MGLSQYLPKFNFCWLLFMILSTATAVSWQYLISEPAIRDLRIERAIQRGDKMWTLQTTAKGVMSLVAVPIPRPGPGQVLVKMVYSPINPSDVYHALGEYSAPGVELSYPHGNGFEGVGVVVGHGGQSIVAWLLSWRINQRVSVATPAGGAWAEYALVNAMEALPVDNRYEMMAAAAAFVNPLTVVAMADVAKDNKHVTMVLTGAASQLGQQMLRWAKKMELQVVTVVRGEKNARLLAGMGHPESLIVRSDEIGFETKLKEVVAMTRATIAFDAVGGEHLKIVFDAMPEHSETYVYGGLSGEPVPASLKAIQGDVTLTKRFDNFHLKKFLDEPRFPFNYLRLARTMYPVYSDLDTYFKTVFEEVIDFKDAKAIDKIKSYAKHQKGGKMLLKLNDPPAFSKTKKAKDDASKQATE
jgi:NADPH2:quinone reductase